MKNIKFTNLSGNEFFEHPVPALKKIPQWYKDTLEYIDNKKSYAKTDSHPQTIKKCIPVFDAMTAGYIISTTCDIEVSIKDGFQYFYWGELGTIDFHPVEQAPIHPAQNGNPYPKWVNFWSVETPPGYSCLFIDPMHNPNNIFTILPAIVDTDNYSAPVNFPFVMNDTQWTGIIPAGTPIAQIIPFKRDSWKTEVGKKKDVDKGFIIIKKLQTFLYNSYKRQFWIRKEYR